MCRLLSWTTASDQTTETKEPRWQDTTPQADPDDASAGLFALAVTFALTGWVEAAKAPEKRPFTERVTSEAISGNGSRSVFEVRDSVSGHGAGGGENHES
jgi:hypothetical protein